MHLPPTSGVRNDPVTNVSLVAGALLVAASAGIHLHLWLDGYRHIPTISVLFVLQVVAGVAVAALLLWRRSALLALVAAGFVVSTMGGFLLCVTVGLFGFQESWASPYAGTAFAVEGAALALVAAGGLRSATRARAVGLAA